MKIIIEIAGDISLNDTTELMDNLQKEVLMQEKYLHIIKDIKVQP